MQQPPAVDSPLLLAIGEACQEVAHLLGWAELHHGADGRRAAMAALREVLDKESQG